MSRLSNSSSTTAVDNTGRLLRVRSSSATLFSAASSPRTPATAIAQTRRRDKARRATSNALAQSRASATKSKTAGAPAAPTCSRSHPGPAGISSPRSTASTSSRQPSLSRRADDVAMARSRLASQSSGDASGVASSNGVKSRQVPTDVKKKDGVAAASTTTQRTGSRKSTNTTIAKRTVKEKVDCPRPQDARHGGLRGLAPDHRKTALLREARRSAVASRSRLGLNMAATSNKGGSTSSVSTCQPVAVAKVAGADAFPSTRYDAMLLREDPRNLTWLRGCDEGEEDGTVAGLDLMNSSLLEMFDMVTGLSRTAVRI